jgi:hypothetical protein
VKSVGTVTKYHKMTVKRIVKALVILQCAISQSLQIQFTSKSFSSCLKSEKPNLISCVGQQAQETLHQLNIASNFTLVEGVVFSKDETLMGRSAPVNFLDNDPTDFR